MKTAWRQPAASYLRLISRRGAAAPCPRLSEVPVLRSDCRNCRALFSFVATVASSVFLTIPLRADDKPAPLAEKPKPKIIVAIPLGLAAGTTTKITLRGAHLDEASEIHFQNSATTAKILSKGKAPAVDKFEAKEVGDTQLEAQVTVPGDTPPGELQFTVVSPNAESDRHSLLVATKQDLVTGKKPGGGFRDALPLALGQSFDGRIEHGKEVHVFRLEGNAGKKIAAEIIAARQGSPLDSHLTLYDSAGHILATNDDSVDSTDSRLEATLPASGPCYLSLIDANDQGSPVHVYRLTVRQAK